MRSKLPDRTPRFFPSICVCAILLAEFFAATSALAADRECEAEGLLSRSIEMVEGRHSISAEVTHRIDLFGKKLVGKGIYREQRSGPHPLVRFELKTPIGDSESMLLQVCDGRYMWNYRVLMGQPRLDRIDLQRLAKALGKQGGDSKLAQPLAAVSKLAQPLAAVSAGAGQGGAGLGGAGLGGTISLGGMPGLLRSLQESFQFASAEADVL